MIIVSDRARICGQTAAHLDLPQLEWTDAMVQTLLRDAVLDTEAISLADRILSDVVNATKPKNAPSCKHYFNQARDL